MSGFLSPEQRNLVTAVVDRLIPAGETMKSASDAGVVDYIDSTVVASQSSVRLFSDGLDAIEEEAARTGASFLDLTGEQQDTVLRTIESESPEFFEALITHTYNGYYSNPAVIETLGLDPRPPQPRGNEVKFGDFSSLDAVVARGQTYRDA